MSIHAVRRVQDSLSRSAARTPAKEAVISGSDRCSYAELHERSRALAATLTRLGLQPGERVAIFMDNSLETVTGIYGTWYAGGVVVIINPQTKTDKLAFMLQDSDAAILLTDTLLSRTFSSALDLAPTVRVVLANGGPTADSRVLDLAAETSTAVPAAADGQVLTLDLAALIYTSGSTGNPKGVMMAHRNMLFALDSLVEYLRLTEADRILNVLPLAFDYGLYQLLMSVHLGATLVLEANFSFPAAALARISEEGITVLPGVPTVFATLVSLQKRSPQVFPSVKRITNTAAHLPDDFVPTLRSMFPQALVFKMYGLTECKRVCYLEPELVDTKPGSVGRPIPGTSVFLLDEEGRRVAPGETGVLHVRGPHVMLGYWKQPQLTKHMLRDGPTPGEGILCTHDFFRFDEDGYLYFVGRSDDIIKTRGEKVSPVEVENALHEIPGVREAAVIGQPDELLGEIVVAYLVVEPEAELTERDVRRQAGTKLESFMVPGRVRFVTELPQTATGKVRKKSLVERAALQEPVTDAPESVTGAPTMKEAAS